MDILNQLSTVKAYLLSISTSLQPQFPPTDGLNRRGHHNLLVVGTVVGTVVGAVVGIVVGTVVGIVVGAVVGIVVGAVVRMVVRMVVVMVVIATPLLRMPPILGAAPVAGRA